MLMGKEDAGKEGASLGMKLADCCSQSVTEAFCSV